MTTLALTLWILLSAAILLQPLLLPRTASRAQADSERRPALLIGVPGDVQQGHQREPEDRGKRECSPRSQADFLLLLDQQPSA